MKQEDKNKKPCSFGENVKIFPDGINELDPCIFEDVAMYTNATVIVSKCKNCGRYSISWLRQEDTEEIDLTKEN